MDKVLPRRADLILTGAIALVAALVLALVLVLGAGGRLFNETRTQRSDIRGARDALIEFTHEQTQAVSRQREYLLSGDRSYLPQYTASKERTQAALARVRALNAHDPDATAIVAELETLLTGLSAALDAGVRARRENTRVLALSSAIEARTEALHAATLRRADHIRLEEDRTRDRIDTLVVILALLSLATCGLAVLALRRERKQWLLAARAAEEARAKAAASDLAKTRFLAVASHDMRQPLHALTLYLSALERRVDAPEARDIIAKMDRATQSLVGMFAKLLDLARIQAGVVKPEIEDVRLQDVLDRIAAENPDRAVEAQPTTLVVRTDPLLLERLLSNLVSNALKHGGGAARIETAAVNGQVEVAVVDNGPGIPPEDQVRIFEEFVRLEGRSEGLGLGLSIVARIGELLDTSIKVQSSVGKGSRFSLKLPRAADEALAADQSVHVMLARAPVLVVDDDPMAREAVAGMLSDIDAEVRATANEAEADSLLAGGFRPQLLMMDLRIDGALVGIDIARRLQAKLTPPPRVVIVTGDTAPETLILLRESGFPWLIKPVNPRELGETAAEQLRQTPISAT